MWIIQIATGEYEQWGPIAHIGPFNSEDEAVKALEARGWHLEGRWDWISPSVARSEYDIELVELTTPEGDWNPGGWQRKGFAPLGYVVTDALTGESS